MHDESHSPTHIQVPVSTVKVQDLIQQLVDENFLLSQKNQEQSNIIDELANTNRFFKELIQQLKDEIAILKRQKPKPKIDPSSLEGQRRKKDPDEGQNPNPDGKPSKPGQPKGKPHKKKKTILSIHERPIIQPTEIPEGAKFKGYRRYSVQDIVFQLHNTQYLIARWKLPDGSYIHGELPKGIHGHYGPELVAYILHQYHGCRVTEPLLLEHLLSRGVLISAGQLNNILIKNKTSFHEEAAELLLAGVKADDQVQADDTGGRHKGKNQYTTVIGNKWFSSFTTTESKSRINFLKLLQGGKEEYLINEDTVAYLMEMNVASYFPGYIGMSNGAKFITFASWEQFLKERNITQEKEVRFVTEAALCASVIANGIPRTLAIHSDDAGQFDIVLFMLSLCWIHEERHYRKLIMTSDEARADLERIRDQIWVIYKKLKAYKLTPNEIGKASIEKEFDVIFQQTTSSPTLNDRLKKTYQKKDQLLKVLERHDIPLHNNASETDARSAKTKLKVSGGTRSDEGRTARDTFLTLKQTCLKLGINFITFLNDRVRELYEIPKLGEYIFRRSTLTESISGAIEEVISSEFLSLNEGLA